MTNEELKEAFLSEEPVICGNIEYECISALIYRKSRSGSGVVVQAELLDKNKNSVSIAEPRRVERKGNGRK